MILQRKNQRYKGTIWLIVEIINFLLLFRIMIIQKEETIWPQLVLEVVIFILAIGSRFYKFFMYFNLDSFGSIDFIGCQIRTEFFCCMSMDYDKKTSVIQGILLFI